MKILLVSDREEPYIWDYFDKERFKDIGLMLSCGDLKNEYLSFLVTMIHTPLFYVPGNHNKDYLDNPPEGCINTDDQVFIYKGIRIAGLGGSFFYGGSTYQYTEEQMKKRIKKLIPKIKRMNGVDIIMTHAPAYGLGDGSDICHRGFQSFIELMDMFSPKYFIHGHQHLTYNIQPRTMKHGNTTIINAFGYHILDY